MGAAGGNAEEDEEGAVGDGADGGSHGEAENDAFAGAPWMPIAPATMVAVTIMAPETREEAAILAMTMARRGMGFARM